MDFDFLIDSCSSSEKIAVKELYPAIKRLVENFNKTTVGYEWSRYDAVPTYQRNVSYYKEKIDRIVRIMALYDQKIEKGLESFPSWKRKRKQNMEKIGDIAEKIITVRLVSKQLRIISGCVGVFGGVTILGSLLFRSASTPHCLVCKTISHLLDFGCRPTPSTASLLAVAGSAATSLHALVNNLTHLTDLLLTDWRLTQVRQVIEKDCKLLEQIGVYEFFDELSDAIDDLFGVSTSGRILGDLIGFINQVPRVLNGVEFFQPDALFLCLSSILPYITEFLLIGPPLASAILSILFASFFSRLQVFPILIHHLTRDLVSAVDGGMEISGLISTIFEVLKLGMLDPGTLMEKIKLFGIAGIGIVLDGTSIVRNSVERKKYVRTRLCLDAVTDSTRAHNVWNQTSIQLLFHDEARACTALQSLKTEDYRCQPNFFNCPVPTQNEVDLCIIMGYGAICYYLFKIV